MFVWVRKAAASTLMVSMCRHRVCEVSEKHGGVEKDLEGNALQFGGRIKVELGGRGRESKNLERGDLRGKNLEFAN